MPSPDSERLYPDKRPFTAPEENKPAGEDDEGNRELIDQLMHQPPTPRSRAQTTAALRRFTPILPYNRATWLRTVFRESPSFSAIALSSRPWYMS